MGPHFSLVPSAALIDGNQPFLNAEIWIDKVNTSVATSFSWPYFPKVALVEKKQCILGSPDAAPKLSPQPDVLSER